MIDHLKLLVGDVQAVCHQADEQAGGMERIGIVGTDAERRSFERNAQTLRTAVAGIGVA